MTTEPIRYDRWIEDALRSVVRRALAQAAAEGLPGEHHFYVTFRTDADGVELADRLRAQHPGEMTIVLQHQFADLATDDEAFSVTLYFGGRPERLRVPFAAITAFADPAVNFGLQLKSDEAEATPEGGDVDAAPDADAAAETAPGEVVALDSFRKK